MLAAIVTASGALALTFGGEYFKEFFDWPTLAVAIGFVAVLSFINYRGISETAKSNMVMTVIEVSGLLIILATGVAVVVSGDAHYDQVMEFKPDTNIALAILGGAALSFFAMTGFENAANVAEETHNPKKVFPKALLGGMAVAGLLYVLVRSPPRWWPPTTRSPAPRAPCSRSCARVRSASRAGCSPRSPWSP